MADLLLDEMLADIDRLTNEELAAEFAEDGEDLDDESKRVQRLLLRALGPPPPPPLRDHPAIPTPSLWVWAAFVGLIGSALSLAAVLR